jgi:phosphomannomutase/phosphoglucomutase
MDRLFGTDGIRGITNQEMNVLFALKVGMAIGTYFGEGSRILMAKDARSGGEMLTRAVQSGLMSVGVKVFDAGYLPTPGLQYGVKTLGYDGGVMITASHNPPEYNGIKVIGSNGVEVDRESEVRIEQIYFEARFNSLPWNRVSQEVRREDRVAEVYTKGILQHVDLERVRQRNFKVVIDGANSVGSLTTPMVANALNCKTLGVNTNLDYNFPARVPEPTVETLKDTAEVVRSVKADLGVAHDGDADRAVFIDSEGRVQWGDRSGTLLSYWASRKSPSFPKRVFTAVSSSSLVEEYLSKVGINVNFTKVGSVIIAHTLLREGGVAGFEENGGFIFPAHQFVRDGAMSFALMLDMLATERISSAELFNTLPRYYTAKTKVPLTNDIDLDRVYNRLIEVYGGKGKVITVDGVKVVSRDFWFLVRKSGTEPILRIMVETKDQEKLNELTQEIVRLITQ